MKMRGFLMAEGPLHGFCAAKIVVGDTNLGAK